MAYVARKVNAFRTNLPLRRQRSEGRIKSYASATDARSWVANREDRRQYIIELVLNPAKGCGLGRYIPIEVIIELLLADLKNRLKELENMLTDDQKAKLGLTTTSGAVPGSAPGKARLGLSADATTGTESPVAADEDNCMLEIKAIEAEIQAMEGGAMSQDQQVDLIKKEVNLLKKYCERLSKIQEENEFLEQQVEALYRQLDCLACENYRLKLQVCALEKSVSEPATQLHNLERERDRLKIKVMKLQNEISDYVCQTEDMTEEAKWLKMRLCQTETALRKCEDNNKIFCEEIECLQSYNAQLQQAMEQQGYLVEENECLKSKLCALQKEMVYCTSDNDTCQSQLAEKLKEYERVVKQKDCLMKRVMTLEEQLASLQGNRGNDQCQKAMEQQGNVCPRSKPCEMLKEMSSICDDNSCRNQKLKEHEKGSNHRDCSMKKVRSLEEQFESAQDLRQMSNCEVQERSALLNVLQEKVNELRNECSRYVEMEKVLANCQTELRYYQCMVDANEAELVSSRCKIKSLEEERDSLKSQVDAETCKAERLKQENDQLQSRVVQLQAIENRYMQCLENLRCLESVKAEKDAYKSKCEQLSGLECEVDMLKAQVRNCETLEAERNELYARVATYEMCIADQEKEITRLVREIEKMTTVPQKKSLLCIEDESNEKKAVVSCTQKSENEELALLVSELRYERSNLKSTICELEGELLTLQRREENAKAAYCELRSELDAYSRACEDAYQQMKEFSKKEENSRSTIESLKEEAERERRRSMQLQEEKEKTLCEISLKNEVIQRLRSEIDVKIELICKLESEIKQKNESIEKIKSVVAKRNELHKNIHENWKQRLSVLLVENECLRKAAKDIVEMSGDNHLKVLLKKSQVTMEKVNRELRLQYTVWDDLVEKQTFCKEMLMLLKQENKKLKDHNRETCQKLERIECENKYLRKLCK